MERGISQYIAIVKHVGIFHESYIINGKFHSPFIYFKVNFNMINRNFLHDILLKYHTTVYIYNAIKALHTNAGHSVMIEDSISLESISTSGVIQGYSMSPILSNLFQNDIYIYIYIYIYRERERER